MTQNKFSVGDNVRKWSSTPKSKLSKEVWVIEKIHENANSQSGIILDVYIPACTHCGMNKRTMVGYDSDWFEKINL